MGFADLVLACGPPIFAIMLQKWSIPSNRSVEKATLEECDRLGLPRAAAPSIESVLKGTLAVSGLATTFVSFPTGAFALFINLGASGLPYVVALMFMAIVSTLIVLRIAGGRSLFEIYEMKLRSPFRHLFGPPFLPFTAAALLRWIVYILNGTLVMLAVLLYWGLLAGTTPSAGPVR